MRSVNRSLGLGMLFAVMFVAVSLLNGCEGDTYRTYVTEVNEDTLDIAIEAYVYGFAPIRVMSKEYDQTNSTADPVYAPVNELYIDDTTSTPDSELWVSPNVNVIYSSAHMDLTTEPMVLYTPSIQDRYFSWEIMDAFTNAFNYIGSRNTGGLEGTYAICGPDWQGVLPVGYTRIDSPTNSVWMVARHEVDPQDVDPADLATVIALVQSSVMLPLSDFIVKDPAYVNPLINKPADEIPELDYTGLNFYTLLNQWLTKNPPPAADDTVMESLAKIGIGPGFTTDFSAMSQANQLKFLAAEKIGLDLIKVDTFYTGQTFNGWHYNLGPQWGDWGTDYLIRAATARCCLGMNINEEAVYPVRLLGPHKMTLSGEKSYSLTIPAADLPVPVNDHGFWSLTMYDLKTASLVENTIDRYSIGNQNNLYKAPDGSITLYIQRDDPGGDQTKNWLPSPQNSDPFYMLFRAYYPDEAMITPSDDPDWIIPDLVRTNP
jgi:hypothetical protein